MIPMQQSIDLVQDQIVGELNALENTIAQYQYLIAQARALPACDVAIRTDENLLHGCQVSVWIHTTLQDGRLRITADSDALINKGMVALLLRVLDNRSPADILATDLHFLDRTGLRTQLSPARANGLAAMVERIRTDAAQYA